MIEGLVMPEKLTVGYLRANFEDWSWRSKRTGKTWEYFGRKGSRLVLIRAYSVISGNVADEYTTQWRVYERGVSTTFVEWGSKERMTTGAKKRVKE
jgi:hypothetical protein